MNKIYFPKKSEVSRSNSTVIPNWKNIHLKLKVLSMIKEMYSEVCTACEMYGKFITCHGYKGGEI